MRFINASGWKFEPWGLFSRFTGRLLRALWISNLTGWLWSLLTLAFERLNSLPFNQFLQFILTIILIIILRLYYSGVTVTILLFLNNFIVWNIIFLSIRSIWCNFVINSFIKWSIPLYGDIFWWLFSSFILFRYCHYLRWVDFNSASLIFALALLRYCLLRKLHIFTHWGTGWKNWRLSFLLNFESRDSGVAYEAWLVHVVYYCARLFGFPHYLLLCFGSGWRWLFPIILWSMHNWWTCVWVLIETVLSSHQTFLIILALTNWLIFFLGHFLILFGWNTYLILFHLFSKILWLIANPTSRWRPLKLASPLRALRPSPLLKLIVQFFDLIDTFIFHLWYNGSVMRSLSGTCFLFFLFVWNYCIHFYSSVLWQQFPVRAPSVCWRIASWLWISLSYARAFVIEQFWHMILINYAFTKILNYRIWPL